MDFELPTNACNTFPIFRNFKAVEWYSRDHINIIHLCNNLRSYTSISNKHSLHVSIFSLLSMIIILRSFASPRRSELQSTIHPCLPVTEYTAGLFPLTFCFLTRRMYWKMGTGVNSSSISLFSVRKIQTLTNMSHYPGTHIVGKQNYAFLNTLFAIQNYLKTYPAKIFLIFLPDSFFSTSFSTNRHYKCLLTSFISNQLFGYDYKFPLNCIPFSGLSMVCVNKV